DKKFFMRTYNPVAKDKNVYAVVAYGVDRTELRKLQEEVEEARTHVGERERLREAIMANLSHEFRTPLTGILGAAQILNYEVSEQGQEFVDMIESSGRRLMNTLNSLLDLAGLKDGGIDVHPRVLELGREVQSVGAAFSAEAEAKGLFLRTKVPDHDVWVRLDQGHLFRILQNLVSNAVKFTETGGVVLEVEQDDERATFRVMDTGVGIDEEYLRTLFDEFQQESLGLARAFEGVGVGLAVTHGLVERMGGTITVESQKGEGSTFSVSFPRAFRVRHDDEASAARVLLIEPAAEDRRIAEYALREVVEVYSAPEINGNSRPPGLLDAALIAVTGPEVDPGAVVRDVRTHSGFEGIPLVALDAYPLPGNRESFISAGFSEYVPKPLNRQVLLDAVSAVCTQSR
ncbi:MAG TPA: ATP-binding protein, partial [Rhodothermales bacterium]